MLLKFKNKHLMALDKMIKEANDSGGMIDSIILDPKEALGLFLEVSNLDTKHFLTNLTLHDRDGNDILREKLLWGKEEIHVRVKGIIQGWYKTDYEVKYKNVKLVVVKPKPEENMKLGGWMETDPIIPKSPVPPQGRMIKEGEQPEPVPTKEPPEPPARSATRRKSPIVVKTTVKRQIPSAEPPEPPKPPPCRILSEDGVFGICEECGSSWRTKWFFFKGEGCIQPECENYWKKNKR